ncbi:MAG: ATP-binding protein [Deltaproteobacteria bacterium]
MPVPRPTDERERLAALRSYHAVEQPVPARVHETAKLVAKLLGVPMALVSLVEDERQWFASTVGFSGTGSRREDAFCAYTILSDEPMVIPDALEDARLRNNPHVTSDPYIRFYAGAPLIDSDGYRLGTLCALDRKPREIGAEDIQILETLSAVVMAELELRRSSIELHEERIAHELAARIANLGHLRVGRDRQLSWSKHAETVLGFTPRRPMTLAHAFGALPDRHVEHLRSSIERTLETGEPFHFEVTLAPRLDRPERHLVFECAPERGSDDEPPRSAVIAVAEDTERRRLHMQVDRLATLGTLTASVAHEINNPLTYVRGNVEMLGEELKTLANAGANPQAVEWSAMMDDISEGTLRVQKIVQSLRTLGRATSQELNVVELRTVVDAAYRVCANELRHCARYRIIDDGTRPTVYADDSQLVQVLTNLMLNAAHAIGQGSASQNEVVVSLATASDETVFVEVRDTGPGMPEEVRAHIFDPFFTTKPKSHGTGLGLSICLGIITAHGGEISVESEVGAGTRIRVTLPRHYTTDAPTTVTTRDPADRAEESRRSVLCVDDDGPVLRAIGRLIKAHDVELIDDPLAALERLRDGATFDVLMFDLMMPTMTGAELYAEVASLRPELVERILILTGGSFHASTAAFEEQMADRLIQKPVTRQALLDAIERVTTRS